MRSNKQVTVREAKANLVASLDDMFPLKTAKERPFRILGLAIAAGVLTGYAGTKVLKRIVSVPSLPLLIIKKLL